MNFRDLLNSTLNEEKKITQYDAEALVNIYNGLSGINTSGSQFQNEFALLISKWRKDLQKYNDVIFQSSDAEFKMAGGKNNMLKVIKVRS